MGLYLCTLYTNEPGYNPEPVTIEGRAVEREIVAATAGKARYEWYLDLCEAWGSARFQDIRVKSLRTRKAHICIGWERRLETANAIVRVIAAHGRHFLSENSDRRVPVENPFVSHFLVDSKHELWFVDRYTRRHILIRHDSWPGWSDGGTLRGIVSHLGEFVSEGSNINQGYFGISPSWMPDHWGYGDDMAKVRDEVAAILKDRQEEK
jgi:hypothetical protein